MAQVLILNGLLLVMENKINMWKHYCKYEKSNMLIEKGCACNWCMAKERKLSTQKTLVNGMTEY